MDWGLMEVLEGNWNGNWAYHYENLCKEIKVKSGGRIDKDHRSRNRKGEEEKEGESRLC